MSKERARLRALREAQKAAEHAARLRRAARRARLRRLVAWLRPARVRLWRGFGRRSPAQRSALIGVALILIMAIWFFIDSWPADIALTVVVLLALPVVAVIFFDRKGIRL